VKFRILCCNAGEADQGSWWEEFDKPGEDAHEAGYHAVYVSWNMNLRPGDKLRDILAIEVLDSELGDALVDHQWRKSNLVTIRGGPYGSYDKYTCEVCGITAKRYGIGGQLVRDTKYLYKNFRYCKS